MTPEEKRILKQKVITDFTKFVGENCSTDEELYLTLLYFNEKIANELMQFNDFTEED